MHRARRGFLTTLVFLFLSSPSFAATYYVPDDFSTIQAALDAATGGDTIIVRDGTYTGAGNKNLDFKGKAVTLRSENGSENCVIDCEGEGRGIHFHGGESSQSNLDALTIINGFITAYGGDIAAGGAIYCESNSSPTISNCAIIGNNAQSGGGIACYSRSHPIISSCEIAGNRALLNSAGGGVYCNDSSPKLVDCIIKNNLGSGIYCDESSAPTIEACSVTENSSDSAGGGIHCYRKSTPLIIGCIVSANTSQYGGGIYSYDSSPIIRTCAITDNFAPGAFSNGAGIACWFSSPAPTISNCTISGNSADSGAGGGISCIQASPNISNCLITANLAALNCGGGIYCFRYASPVISNCTISENVADIGGGIHSYWESSPALSNSILWRNSAIQGAQVAVTNSYLPASISVAFSDVQGGYSDIYIESGCTVDYGSHNIDADPLFAACPLGHLYHLSQIAAGEVLDSPCVDAGSDTADHPDIGLDKLTTRTDHVPDSGFVDMGFHYGPVEVGLTSINLEFPPNLSSLSAPPAYSWTVDDGENNAFAVDFALPPSFPFWSTYENMHIAIYGTTWAMPGWMWDRIPSGKRVYWRVRGADLNLTPLTPVTSDEVWSFTKQ
jgi:parallel beta-helix repeat protein